LTLTRWLPEINHEDAAPVGEIPNDCSPATGSVTVGGIQFFRQPLPEGKELSRDQLPKRRTRENPTRSAVDGEPAFGLAGKPRLASDKVVGLARPDAQWVELESIVRCRWWGSAWLCAIASRSEPAAAGIGV